ncbi:hypothetical protein HFU84_06980 [Acidithiobacillus sp. CV18-2]|nr:hypothetical protein [Acidithiobacillus sp. CV18-3]MBU2756002.1 hypothetical protein [Acidithiobacillus sp. BN09-2]MBU2777249.1 hypothetical protein [Acidithiobacillus sp. CV18-2]MBU2799901.1 hypothetical protein [Acidithiobacillus sp. VAN18-4]
MNTTAFIPEADPLHREVQTLIEKNPHSRGFVANQIFAQVEAHGLWNARELDADGVTFGPSQKVEQQQKVEMEHDGLPESGKQELAVDPEIKKPAPLEKPVVEPEQPWPQPPETKPLFPQEPRAAEPEKATNRPSFARQKPVPILAHKNRPLVLDYGDHITVTRRAMLGIGRTAQEKRELAVGTALQAAVQRFGQPVHFEGHPAFLKQTAEMAVKMGIQLEPGNKLAAEIYQKALKDQEQSRAPRGNVLGPARQQPQKQQDQDLER